MYYFEMDNATAAPMVFGYGRGWEQPPETQVDMNIGVGLLVLGMFALFNLLGICGALLVTGISRSPRVRRAYLDLLLRVFEYARQVNEEALRAEEREEDAEMEKLRVRLAIENLARLNDYYTSQAWTAHCRKQKRLESTGGRRHKKRAPVRPTAMFKARMEQCCRHMSHGMRIIIEDRVTPRFRSEELANWNLLSRHMNPYRRLSWRLTGLWLCGLFVRYLVLFPVRLLLCFSSVVLLSVSSLVLGQLPNSERKFRWIEQVMQYCFRSMSCSLSAVLSFKETKPIAANGICVANHTSPLDVLVLMCNGNYSLVGQRHGGVLGIIQRALSRDSAHMWFERAETKDRRAVSTMLRMHVAEEQNPPVLIFPEGTCINNTSVMKFKKGCFETTRLIHPIALKYDRRYGDAFWDSSRYSMLHYICMMLTSWSILCTIHYLPPIVRRNYETGIVYAGRVEAAIAKTLLLEDLNFDGNLKRWQPQRDWKRKPRATPAIQF